MSRTADLYDLLFASTNYLSHAQRVRAIVSERNPHARSLLDVACGPGRHLEQLRASYEVQGLDADEWMLRLAASRLPGVPLHLGGWRSQPVRYLLESRWKAKLTRRRLVIP